MGKTKGGFSEVHYLTQGTPGLSERGNARRDLGSPLPPESVEEAIKLIRADLGEAPPSNPGPGADLGTVERALAAEDAARFARLLVVATLRAEARRTDRWVGWTLGEVRDLWLATGLNASGAVEGTRHLDKVLLRARRLSRDRLDPPTLGRANGRPNTFWVPRKAPTWDPALGWVWRGPRADPAPSPGRGGGNEVDRGGGAGPAAPDAGEGGEPGGRQGSPESEAKSRASGERAEGREGPAGRRDGAGRRRGPGA